MVKILGWSILTALVRAQLVAGWPHRNVAGMSVPIACSLTAVDVEAQVERWRQLATRPDVTIERRSPTEVAIHLGQPQDLAEIVALAQAEKACCPFFEFDLEIKAESVTLRVEAPDDAVAVLDALVGQTA
jgi:MerR family transcriptional regulator, copper efflux regulator